MSEFVNPYTFIPLPSEVRRREPLGHTPSAEQARDRYVGSFTVSWTLKTPLTCPLEEWGTVGGRMSIPGASMKGTVRSVHETLFGGCLRQVDLDFRPIYRELPKPNKMAGWQLAVIRSVTNGDVDVWLCEEPTDGIHPVVEAHQLKRTSGVPRTGDVLTIDDDAVQVSGRRKLATRVNKRERPRGELGAYKGGYVVLITSTETRDRRKCYWSIGKLTDHIVVASPDALKNYRWRLKNARENGSANDDVYDVHHANELVGRRYAHDRDLTTGDVVWVRRGESNGHQAIVDISRSQLWRREIDADRSMRPRIPESLYPCHEEALCLSCSIFGSADPEGIHRAPKEGRTQVGARQDSYGGHVRFGPATTEAAQGFVDQTRWSGWLAPLAQPHPGAGMMYVDPDVEVGAPESSDYRQTRWDSDKPNKLRPMRGRKYYWFSDPLKQQEGLSRNRGVAPLPRFARRPNHTVTACTEATLLMPGQVFTQRVTFDCLDALSVQTLLAAFQPGSVLDAKDVALHLGRGKPFGLGAAVAEVSEIRITTVADRYSHPTTVLSGDVFKEVDRDALQERCGSLDNIHKVAAKVMSLTGLGSDEGKVAYPTTRPWTEYGQIDNGNRSAFDESFTYFSKYDGKAEKPKGEDPRWRGGGTYRTMPRASDPSQIMRGEQR